MKQLVAFGIDGQISQVSIEDIVSAKLNTFQGWNCNAGIQNLYIDFDGNVWPANCASANQKRIQTENAWGYLGKVGTQFALPESPVVCPYKHCGCGSDIVISKHDKAEPLPTGFSTWQRMQENTELVNSKKVIGIRTNYPMEKQILWDIGRFCNYNCSYCWPGVHNKTDPHKSLSTFVSTADYLIDNWSKGHQIRWYFGGGEPTLNPDFEPFVEHLSSRNQWVMLVSNGSQGPAYWAKNSRNYNTLIFSAHFEFMKPDLFIKNYARVVETMMTSRKPERFIVKLMTKAGELQKSEDFIEQLKASCDFNKMKHRLSFDVVPLRHIVDGSRLNDDYTDEELAKIIKINSI